MMELTPRDLFIAVIHSRQTPWEEIAKHGQLATWVPGAIDAGYNVVYCYGRVPKKITARIDRHLEKYRWNFGSRISDVRNLLNIIIAKPFAMWVPKAKREVFADSKGYVVGISVPLTELYVTTRWKQLSLFKYFIENTRCRYLVMVTSATYCVPAKMLREIGKLSGKTIYAGPLHAKNTDGVFVSGAQLILDRHFIEELLDNPKLLPTHLLNDVGLGVYARKRSIKPLDMKTLDVSSMAELEHTTDDVILNHHHFRLKSIDPMTGKRQDVGLFLQLHERLKSLGG
jgi:hypothetical protein